MNPEALTSGENPENDLTLSSPPDNLPNGDDTGEDDEQNTPSEAVLPSDQLSLFGPDGPASISLEDDRQPGRAQPLYSLPFPVSIAIRAIAIPDGIQIVARIFRAGREEFPAGSTFVAACSDPIHSFILLAAGIESLLGHFGGPIREASKFYLEVIGTKTATEIPIHPDTLDDAIVRYAITNLFNECHAATIRLRSADKAARTARRTEAISALDSIDSALASVSDLIVSPETPGTSQTSAPGDIPGISAFRKISDQPNTIRLRVAKTVSSAIYPEDVVPNSKMVFEATDKGYESMIAYFRQNGIQVIVFPQQYQRGVNREIADRYIGRIRALTDPRQR